MANSYPQTTWQDGVTPMNATNFNNIEAWLKKTIVDDDGGTQTIDNQLRVRSSYYSIIASGTASGILNQSLLAFTDVNNTVQGYVGKQNSVSNHIHVTNTTSGGDVRFYVQDTSGSPSCCVRGDGTDIYFRPSSDNIGYLGSSSQRWKAVYAVNGTIITSSAYYKENISYLDGSDVPEEYRGRDENDPYVTPTEQEIRDFIAYTYKPAIYTRISDTTDEGLPRSNGGNTEENIANLELGFIADDVDEMKMFELFGHKVDENTHNIHQGSMIHMALVTCQTLAKENDELRARLDALESRLSALEN